MVLSKRANLIIDSTDGTWLKIVADGIVAFGIKNTGELKIDAFKVTSWSTLTNTYASANTDGTAARMYIVGGTGKANSLNFEIAHLGYAGTGQRQTMTQFVRVRIALVSDPASPSSHIFFSDIKI